MSAWRRREVIGECTLYLGDCLEVLPEVGPVDAVLTDPPYCSGGFSEAGKGQARGQGLRSETVREVGWFINDRMTTGGIVWLLRRVAVQAFGHLADGGSMLVFTDWRMLGNLSPAIESAGFRYQNLVVWKKPSVGLGTGFRAQHELVMHFVKGMGRYWSNMVGNVIECGRVGAAVREHQTEKPVELVRTLADVVAGPGATICDPFMGSASVGVAAVRDRRRFVGIEIDPGHFETACRRIEAEVRAPRLVLPMMAEPAQQALL